LPDVSQGWGALYFTVIQRLIGEKGDDKDVYSYDSAYEEDDQEA